MVPACPHAGHRLENLSLGEEPWGSHCGQSQCCSYHMTCGKPVPPWPCPHTVPHSGKGITPRGKWLPSFPSRGRNLAAPGTPDTAAQAFIPPPASHSALQSVPPCAHQPPCAVPSSSPPPSHSLCSPRACWPSAQEGLSVLIPRASSHSSNLKLGGSEASGIGHV